MIEADGRPDNFGALTYEYRGVSGTHVFTPACEQITLNAEPAKPA
jgi:hypothetical protein